MYDAVIGRGVAAIKGNEFIYQSLVKMDIDGYWKRFAEGSTFESINSNTLFNAEMSIPSNQEQRKIGAFFSMLDKAIALHQRKENLLRELKKGMLQKIFSQEIRFKDDNGQNYPDWGEKHIADISTKIGSGKTPKGGANSYKDDGIPLIRSQNVENGRLNLDDVAFIDEATNNEMSNSGVFKHDILLNITGASIGRCCEYLGEGKANVNQHVCIIRVTQNPGYILQYMLSQFFQREIDRVQSGGSKQGLNFKQIGDFTVPIPSIHEQEKIADYLMHIDSLITSEQEKISSLQTMKKGFLQKMFV